MTGEKYNRKQFFKLAGAGILLGTAFLWDKMVRSQKQLLQPQTLALPFSTNQEFTFHPRVIVVNHQQQTSVFSSRCTHLGCTINQAENGVLVCPCHGSHYDLHGKPIKGPAIRPLQKLGYQIDAGKQQITIDL